MSFLGFLFRKKFYIQLGISFIVSFIFLLIMLWLLKIYTRHGDVLVIPDFKGLTMSQIIEKDYDRKFDFIVTDSLYDPDLPPGSVAMQNPSAGSKVKKGRNVYVTLVSVLPEMTMMPDLKDLTIRQAVSALKSSGLKSGRLTYIQHIAENSVLGQYYNGDTIYYGIKLLKGSVIDLVVGLGENHVLRPPFLIGLTAEEAREKLHMASLNLGQQMHSDPYDPFHSRVFQQSPAWDTLVPMGTIVNLWYRSDVNFNFERLVKMINPDSTRMETLSIEELEDIEEE